MRIKQIGFFLISGTFAGVLGGVALAGGGMDGGGGAQIESAFRIRAYELINEISNSHAANALCSSTTVQAALDGTKIRIVGQLINPATHLPITDQNLDAYTMPGDMQLLQSSWQNFFNSGFPPSGKSIDVLMIHELYRATGSKCNDDNFVLSDRIPTLLQNGQPTQYSKMYKFAFERHLTCNTDENGNIDPEGVYYQDIWGTCDSKDKTKKTTCLILDDGTIGSITIVEFTPYRGRFIYHDVLSVPFRDENKRLNAMLSTVDQNSPFFVVLDRDTGTLLGGLDLKRLAILNNGSEYDPKNIVH